MFPIRELGGSVLAFSGRILAGPNGEPPADTEPKYVNSPEGPLYSKGNVLYGLHEARVEVRRNGWALLCEGNFDLLALHQAGFGNALAPMGTAFTAAQAKLLGRFAQRVTLLFDGDAAGAKAVRAAYPLLQQQGLRGTVAELPKGEDPDSFLRGQRGRRHAAPGRRCARHRRVPDRRGRRSRPAAAHPSARPPSRASSRCCARSRIQWKWNCSWSAWPSALRCRTPPRCAASCAATRRPGRRANRTSREHKHSELAEQAAYVRLPRLQTELLGVLLDRPALFATEYASQLEGLLTSAPLRGVFRAAAAVDSRKWGS